MKITKHSCAIAAGTESAEELLQRATSTSGGNGNGNGNGNGSAPVRFDGRAFRRALNKTGRYVRQPIDDAESLALMEEHGVGYSSTGLIARMRQNGNVWQEKVCCDGSRLAGSGDCQTGTRPGSVPSAPLCRLQDVKVKLAQAYGYCWGVERAVQMAYEARKQYPKARVHVTNEIIHNPAVNQVPVPPKPLQLSHRYQAFIGQLPVSRPIAACILCTAR
jgi:4-hydroxy-3-methylbut-2-enyl diphosphate reductase